MMRHFSSGGGGSRTRVQKYSYDSIYMFIPLFKFRFLQPPANRMLLKLV